MAFLAGLFGALGRFAGKILTTTLGWASTLLFGRVPQDRQIVLALITFGSVIWAALAIGVVVPGVGTFLIAAVPAPAAIDKEWIRLAMLIGAIVVPIVVGIATLFVVDAADRPTGGAMLGQILRGYPLCAVLAVVLVLLAAVGVARFVHHLAIGWSDEHVPVVVHPGGYQKVVDGLERALDDADLAVDERPAPAPLALPGRLLGAIAGAGMKGLVADRPVRLVGHDLEVGLYPSDIAIGGKKDVVARARAAIATRLTTTAASMTTSAEAQEIEAMLARVARRSSSTPDGAEASSAAPTLAEVDRRLSMLAIPHDEWEILYRERLQVERDLLAGDKPGERLPGEGTARAKPVERSGTGGDASGRPLTAGDVALLAATFGLIALDIVTAIAERRRR